MFTYAICLFVSPLLCQVRNTHLWLNTGWQPNDLFNATQGDPAVVEAAMLAFLRAYGNATGNATLSSFVGLHWYVWDEIRHFDTHYPDYAPEKPGFEATAMLLNNLGVKVIPYVNGRVWDLATPSWNASHAEESAAKMPYPVMGDKVRICIWGTWILDLRDVEFGFEGRGIWI